MTYDDLIAKWGTPTGIAKALGVTRQRVNYWRKVGTIPAATQALIQVKTRGRMRATLDAPRETQAAE